jgi:hypothetical protein
VWGVLSGKVPASTFGTSSKKQVPLAMTLRQIVYEHMYNARNAYLHGNAVDDSRLYLPAAAGDLSMYAAVLYRLMLTEFLELHPSIRQLSPDDPKRAEKLGAAVSDYLDINGPIKQCNEALLTIGGYCRRVLPRRRRIQAAA